MILIIFFLNFILFSINASQESLKRKLDNNIYGPFISDIQNNFLKSNNLLKKENSEQKSKKNYYAILKEEEKKNYKNISLNDFTFNFYGNKDKQYEALLIENKLYFKSLIEKNKIYSAIDFCNTEYFNKIIFCFKNCNQRARNKYSNEKLNNKILISILKLLLNDEGNRKNIKKNSPIKFENSDFYNENDYSYPGQFYKRYGCIIENFLKIDVKNINFQKKFSPSKNIILCVYSKLYYEELSKSKKIKL